MNKFYFFLYWIILVVISFMLIANSSCKKRKNIPGNDSELVNFKAKVASLIQNHPDIALKYADSAFNLFKTFTVEDSVKTEWLQLRADIYIALGQSDSAYNTFLNAHDQSIISGNKIIQAYSDLWLGQQFTDDGKYFLAGKYLKEGLTLNEDLGNEYNLARSQNLYGIQLSFNGNYQEAQEHLIKATGLFEKLGNIKALGAVYNNIATNYEATNDNEIALFYFKKALDFSFQQSDTVNIISTLNNFGIHYRLSNPDSAEFYFTEALKFHQSALGAFEIISVKFNLANLYVDRKDFSKAKAMYQQVMDICIENGIYSGLARTYNGIGNICEAQNDDVRAMDYYQRAYQLADSIGETPVAMVFLGNIQYMHEKARNFEDALVLHKKIEAVDDSLLSLEKQIALHELEMLYNNEKAASENKELSIKLLIQENSLRTNRIILFIVLISLVGLIILLWNIYNLYRQRDEAYNALILKYRKDTLQDEPDIKTWDNKKLIPELITESDNPMYKQLIVFFETEKPYLKYNLQFDDVALNLKISRKMLSHLFPEHAGMNFKTFVNSYRIREALQMLSEPGLQHYKIEAIAKEAGFGSKASFYAAFGNITGSRPSEHR